MNGMSDMTLQEAADATQFLARQMRGVMMLAEMSGNIVRSESLFRETMQQCNAMREEVSAHKTKMREFQLATEERCKDLVIGANAEVMKTQAKLSQAQDELQRIEQASALASAELERIEQAVAQAKQAAAEIVSAAN